MRTHAFVFTLLAAVVLPLMASNTYAQQRTMALRTSAVQPIEATSSAEPSLQARRIAQTHEVLQGLQHNDYRNLRRAMLETRRIKAVADIRRVHRLYLAEWGKMTGYTLETPTLQGEEDATYVTLQFERGTQVFKLNWYNDALLSMIKASN